MNSKPASLRTMLRPPSQPTSHRAWKVSPPARPANAFICLVEAIDPQATPDFGAHGAGSIRQQGFERLHVHGQTDACWARQPVGPPGGIDVLIEELEAREVTGGPALLMRLKPMGGRLGRACGVVRALAPLRCRQEGRGDKRLPMSALIDLASRTEASSAVRADRPPVRGPARRRLRAVAHRQGRAPTGPAPAITTS